MKNKSLFDSFNNATLGLIRAIKTERNLKIHILATVVVFIASLFFNLTTIEILILMFTIVLVITTELINTSIESALDAMFGNKRNSHVKKAKDVAAAAVLMTTLNSILVAYVLFYNKIVNTKFSVFTKLKRMPVYITLISIILIIIFTLVIKTMTSHNKMLRGGMPSGHSALSFGLATVVGFLGAGTEHEMLLITLAYILAFLVAQSRVEGNIHSAYEVIAGAILGFLSVMLMFSIFA